ncbi:hypothetical protein GCM10010308_26360 [Streptomyces vinaceusdrappus]|nr:hypothetical protein GCM10010301_48060 [Streptomyces plicatus]GHC11022.1 hypothetical protein GCM10010308_26360 [Streptomyces vinaceusdrappus]
MAELADLHPSILEMDRSDTICWTADRAASQPGGMTRRPPLWLRLVAFARALAHTDHHYGGGY